MNNYAYKVWMTADKIASGEVLAIDLEDARNFLTKKYGTLHNWHIHAVYTPSIIPRQDNPMNKDALTPTLKARQQEYGDFKDVAELSQHLQYLLKRDDYSAVQREAIAVICSKLSRIVNGNCNNEDSWLDIAGYATLVFNSITEKPIDSGQPNPNCYD